MKPLRQAVEFKKKSETAFTGCWTNAVILINCHTCLYGSQSTSYFNKKFSFKSTNSNLRKHITSNHPAVFFRTSEAKSGHGSSSKPAHLLASAESPMVDDSASTIASTSSKQLKLMPQQQQYYYRVTYQSFRIVEDKGFQEFVHALNPSYQLPNRKKISKTLIPARYEKCLYECRQVISNVKKICLTTDCWTSVNTESFIAVTGHFINQDFKLVSILLECSVMKGNHTSENLAATLNRIVTDWGLQDKILLVVSDNASNIKKLYVRSSISYEKLAEYQKQMNQDVLPLKLIQDVSTRWNSTYFMLERFTHLENAIKSTLSILDNCAIPVLTPTGWKICKELSIVLGSFEKTTKTISGENYLTGSYVIPLKKFEDPVIQVITKLNEGLHSRLGQVEGSNTLGLATFFDPRFKNMAFQNGSIAENTKKQIISLVAGKIEANRDNCINESHEDDYSDSDELSIWGPLKSSITSKAQPKNNAMSHGMIISLVGAFEGRRHDAGILRESNLYEQLQTCASFPDRQKFVIYGDQAYGIQELLLCPFTNRDLTPQQQAFNNSMKPLRQAVE
nr:unnamed protein product [Callosobruchus chinensis]